MRFNIRKLSNIYKIQGENIQKYGQLVIQVQRWFIFLKIVGHYYVAQMSIGESLMVLLKNYLLFASCSKADDEPKFRNQEGRHGKTDWDRAMITHSAQTTERFIPTEMSASLINMINQK